MYTNVRKISCLLFCFEGDMSVKNKCTAAHHKNKTIPFFFSFSWRCYCSCCWLFFYTCFCFLAPGYICWFYPQYLSSSTEWFNDCAGQWDGSNFSCYAQKFSPKVSGIKKRTVTSIKTIRTFDSNILKGKRSSIFTVPHI